MATETDQTWRGLLSTALQVIESLQGAGYGRLAFRLGGGTVLMFRLHHRISNDIDLFIDDAQALSFLSPRLNETAAALTSDYQEQANAVKLVLPDGDIDFIVAGTVTRIADPDTLDFAGHTIALEPTAEILAKKILYRGASFKPRDVFDMVAAMALDPGSATLALQATHSAHPVLRRRLDTLHALGEIDLVEDIAATATGRFFIAGMVERLANAIEDRQ